MVHKQKKFPQKRDDALKSKFSLNTLNDAFGIQLCFIDVVWDLKYKIDFRFYRGPFGEVLDVEIAHVEFPT